VATLLLNKGADAHAKTDEVRCMPSYKAWSCCDKRDQPFTKADSVRVPLQAGWTALHAAAGQGHVRVMSLLLNTGAGANAKSGVCCPPSCKA
jgi:ankyrin repeat protein